MQAELVASTLQTAYEQITDDELARRYIARKRIKKPQDDKETARLVRRLVGAGFSFAIISNLLKSWEIDLALPEDGVAE